jgi:hypothetical protein
LHIGREIILIIIDTVETEWHLIVKLLLLLLLLLLFIIIIIDTVEAELQIDREREICVRRVESAESTNERHKSTRTT